MSDHPWWQKLTTTGRVSLAFVAYVTFSVLFFAFGPFQDVAAAGGIVDDDFGQGAQHALDAVATLGPDGQEAYTLFLLGDLIYALMQGLWMAGFIILGMRRWRALPRWAPWLPVAATAADWLENVSLLAILQAPNIGVAWIAVVAMHVKLLCVILSALAVIAVLGWWISHPVRRQPRRLQPTRTRARDAPGPDGQDRGPHARRKTQAR